MTRMQFMNTEIDNLTMDEALEAIEDLIKKDENAYVLTPNVDHIVQLEQKGILYQAYRDAALILTDGKPLLWIAKWYGNPIKEKISGSDLFPKLMERAAQKEYSVFLLGAAEGVAAKAAENLQKRYQELIIAGTYSPPWGFEKDPEELQKTMDEIRAAKPQLLIVGLGCPKQEAFVWNNRSKLGIPVSLCLGACLDYESGYKKRAPAWMADHGLEWIYRTLQEPKRMGKRYFGRDFRIFGLAWKYRKRRQA